MDIIASRSSLYVFTPFWVKGKKNGYRRLSTLCGRALVCIPGGLEPEREVFHSFCRLICTTWVAGGGVFDVSLPLTTALFVCLPGGREDKRVEHLFLSMFYR